MSVGGSVSSDGSRVAFESSASNLVPADTNSERDVFVYDLPSRVTALASVAWGGGAANGKSDDPALSADGRFIAFVSEASNLVPIDTNGIADVFVHDLLLHQTERVSVSSVGVQANGFSRSPAISGDGRFVAFSSAATNLAPAESSFVDLFIRDRASQTTLLISIGSDGGPTNGPSGSSSISLDGRYVAFASHASNLVPNDTNNIGDVFVWDQTTSATTRVSVSSSGEQGNDLSAWPVISGGGRFVAFVTGAKNLAPFPPRTGVGIVRHDRITGETILVSVDSIGIPLTPLAGDGIGLSSDGRYVAFAGVYSSQLLGRGLGVFWNVWVRNVQSRASVVASVREDGQPIDGSSGAPSLSYDGSLVVFDSDAALEPDDENGVMDIYLRDRGAIGCPMGVREEGSLSSRLHDTEDSLGPGAPMAHETSCAVASLGL